MSLTDKIIIASICAIFTGIIMPIGIYFTSRLINCIMTKFTLDVRTESDYLVYNIRIHNLSFVTLKNVFVHVTIDNDKNDIIKNLRIKIFCSDTKVDNGMLSWSKNIDNKNYPHIDINQGESPDVNFIRFHSDNSTNAIEIASEQGFFDEHMNNTARTVLKANRNYTFQVKLTADNIWPKKQKFNYNNSSRLVTKGSA